MESNFFMNRPQGEGELTLRRPKTGDAYPIHQLIAASPPLDLNSIYSYHLFATHFTDTSVVAEANDSVVGFISAYRPPSHPDALFVWQVVVDASQRGRGVAAAMLDELMERHGDIRYLEATVNPSNQVSRRLFERYAERHGYPISEETFMSEDDFGPAAGHESEILLRIARDS